MSEQDPPAHRTLWSRWRGLDSLTRGLSLLALVSVVAVNLFVLAIRAPVSAMLQAAHPGGRIDDSTTLHHTAHFLLLRGAQAQDSWEPLRHALAYVHAPLGDPLYTAVFFKQGTLFQYPPSSLLFVDLLGRFFPGGIPPNWPLNLLSWLAVVATAALTTRVLLVGIDEHLGARFDARPWERAALGGLAVALTLTFYPIVKGFSLGQIQTWITALFAAAVLALARRRRMLAGALSAIICLIKPPLGLLVLWALLRKQHRFLCGWLLVAVPLGAVSLWLYRAESYANYVELLSFLTRHSWSYYPNQTVNGLLNRALFIGSNLFWDPHFLPYDPWVTSVTIVSSLVIVIMGLRWRNACGGPAEAMDFCMVALCATVASPLAWEHHYGVLMPMFAFSLPISVRLCDRRALLCLGAAFVLTSNFLFFTGLVADTHFNVLQSYLFAGALIMLAALHDLRQRCAGVSGRS